MRHRTTCCCVSTPSSPPDAVLRFAHRQALEDLCRTCCGVSDSPGHRARHAKDETGTKGRPYIAHRVGPCRIGRNALCQLRDRHPDQRQQDKQHHGQAQDKGRALPRPLLGITGPATTSGKAHPVAAGVALEQSQCQFDLAPLAPLLSECARLCGGATHQDAIRPCP